MAKSIEQNAILELAEAVGRSYAKRDRFGNGIAITFSPDSTFSVGQYVENKYLLVATSRPDITADPQEGTNVDYVAERLEDLIDPKPLTVELVDIDIKGV